MCGLFYTNDLKETNIDIIQEKSSLISHRGPDNDTQLVIENNFFRFHRLSIIDTSSNGNQPFFDKENNIILMCNGEIYNNKLLRKTVNYNFKSNSDCEVIIPLYLKLGFNQAVKALDGEFAIVLYDIKNNKTFFARDEIGIRPLFVGETNSSIKKNKTKSTKEKRFYISSELKSINSFCRKVEQVKPGFTFSIQNNKVVKEEYNLLWKNNKKINNDASEAKRNIKSLLIKAVEKRLESDVPIGFLLSGGLDSSIVCSIASRFSEKPITTFSVGITEDPIDTKYAKEVSNFLNSNHHEFLFTKEDVINHLDELIYSLETWDITTIRASMGMSLLCSYIKKNTDCKVILTGEVSDEIFGYKYTDYAPSSTAFQKEAEKRLKELCYFDVLRADRCISKYGLEARVPFSDKAFVKYVMNIDPKIKMNTTGIGKYLLRASFEGDFLPESILYREKAAFSDAVGHSMVNYLIEHANNTISDEEFENRKETFKNNTPFTKESYLYRKIFEKHYPERSNIIPDFWMPNKSWSNCDVNDPSARVLPNYGKSGA